MSLCVNNGEKAFRKNMDQIELKNLGELKPSQNKKGQKKFEVPDKKVAFFLKKGLFFCRVPQSFLALLNLK